MILGFYFDALTSLLGVYFSMLWETLEAGIFDTELSLFLIGTDYVYFNNNPLGPSSAYFSCLVTTGFGGR